MDIFHLFLDCHIYQFQQRVATGVEDSATDIQADAHILRHRRVRNLLQLFNLDLRVFPQAYINLLILKRD